MNRREFMRRSLAVAAALGLPAGVALGTAAEDAPQFAASVLTLEDIQRLRDMLDKQAIPGPYYFVVHPDPEPRPEAEVVRRLKSELT